MTMYSETRGQNQGSGRYYPARQEDPYAEDTERLYESFNDLYEDFDDGRSKTPFVIIGALLAIAIVGGGLAFAYKRGMQTDGDGTPLIVADRGAQKVAPDEPGGMEIPHQDSLIFNRINGEGAGEADSVPAEMPARSEASGPPLTIGDLASRVTSEAGPARPLATADTPARSSETLLSPAGRGSSDLPKALLPPGAEAPGENGAIISPRKVETFTITPDGRIVSQPATAPETGQPAAASQAGQAGETVLARSRPLEVPALPSAIEPAGRGTPEPASLPSSGDAGPRTPNLPGGGTASLAPSPQPKPRPTTRDLEALREARARNEARPQPAPAETPGQNEFAGQFAVQVASNQRQADSLAIFADLQRRFPNLVSGFRPLIQRADLGSRGIFYRLRIGPITSRTEANQLCGSLRNAGLPGCIVRTL